ncbi:MAG: hypothetical protein LBC79_04505 [Deltaproteobacteria bacterium]|jgi:hypothetical protein|nr:hypothetical protein [Deltaproteobacteria bacterium]
MAKKPKIARVFCRRTSATPTDSLAFVDEPPPLFMPEIDEVHVSVAFSWDLAKADVLHRQWGAVGVPVKVGGPALGEKSGEFTPGMYVKPGITITSRGCPNKCWFCGVPVREGPVRELEIKDGWNVYDDNLLACSDAHIRAVFDMLSRQPERVALTGGLEARRLKPWHCGQLRIVKPHHMYFAYDTPDDYEPLVAAGRMLGEYGFTAASHVAKCYVLIGYQGDTFSAAEKRLADTIKAGFMPYAMLYNGQDDNKDKDWARFQRDWLRPVTVGAKMRLLARPPNITVGHAGHDERRVKQICLCQN